MNERIQSGEMVLREGITCWRCVTADRVAFLIDAASYFDRLASSLERARRSIFIVGWDIHSQTRLRRGDGVDEDRYRLGPLLDRLARDNRRLRINILTWDFSMLYAAERETLQRVRLGWKSHRRVHFELDSNHPIGACHHQKIVVVDDQVAFVGGLDLTMRRWDTSEHAPAHSLRKDPDGKPYGPFHDVQVALSGPAAQALGDLVRERWKRATGRRLRRAEAEQEVWPTDLQAELAGVEVGICRTEPRHDARQEVREIERLYQDAIAAANHSIILENQYATSAAIAAALEASLREPEGPEVLLIQPRRNAGWLEQTTIGGLRQRFLERVRAADTYGRFLSCYPYREALGEGWIRVHSKVCFVDDSFVTVGSANLANRSMGLDTECNLAIAIDDAKTRRAIRHFRDRLLGEHLGTEPDHVADTLERSGSLNETVRLLGTDRRRLEPLETTDTGSGWLVSLVPDENLLDPEEPLEALELLEKLGGEAGRHRGSRRPGWRETVAAILLAIFLIVAWHQGQLSDWLTSDQMKVWVETYRDCSAALPLTVALFILGGIIFFPVTLLIVLTTIVFGPVQGFVYSLLGSLVTAALMFGLGRFVGGKRIRRLSGKRLHRLARFLARRGTLSVAAARLTPIAPFSMVNLGAGAVGIRWLPFLLGTLLGLVPGIAALSLLGDRAAAAIREPSWHTILELVIVAVLLFGIGTLLARKTIRHSKPVEDR